MNPDEILKLAENIYAGLSNEDIEEIERITLDRSNFSDNSPKRVLELVEGIDEEFLDQILAKMKESKS